MVSTRRHESLTRELAETRAQFAAAEVIWGKKRAHSKQALDKRRNQVKCLGRKITALTEARSRVQAIATVRLAVMTSHDAEVAAKDATIVAKTTLVEEQADEMEEQADVLVAREASLKACRKSFGEKCAMIVERNTTITNQQERIEELKAWMGADEEELEELREQAKKDVKELKGLHEKVKKDKIIAALTTEVEGLRAKMSDVASIAQQIAVSPSPAP